VRISISLTHYTLLPVTNWSNFRLVKFPFGALGSTISLSRCEWRCAQARALIQTPALRFTNRSNRWTNTSLWDLRISLIDEQTLVFNQHFFWLNWNLTEVVKFQTGQVSCGCFGVNDFALTHAPARDAGSSPPGRFQVSEPGNRPPCDEIEGHRRRRRHRAPRPPDLSRGQLR